jgi:flagellar basal body-associated protein FliL
MGKLKENWQLALFITVLSVVMSTMGAMVVQRTGVKDSKIDDAAPMEYVNQKQVEMKGYVDTQDDVIRRDLQQIKAHNETFEQRIDQKLDNIYNILIQKK